MKKLILVMMAGSLILSCGSISSTTLYPASNQTSNEFISQRNLFIDKQNLSDGFANEEIVEYTSSECGDGWCNGNETSQTCPEDCNRNVAGCTDESACNYNPDATEDDGSCIYAEENFDCDGNCIVEEDCVGVCGGMNVPAFNCPNGDIVCSPDDCEDDNELGIGISNFPYNYNIFSTYPNPFNPIININYELPENVTINIQVYDINGNYVTRLINTFQIAGYHTISWNASSYPSGVYCITMKSGGFIQTQKVVLLK